MRLQNRSLLKKWLWRFNKEDALWICLIKEKYGKQGEWWTQAPAGTYRLGCWKNIMVMWPNFEKIVGFKIGNDRRISFFFISMCNFYINYQWEEISLWIGDRRLSFFHDDLIGHTPMKEQFHQLYNLVNKYKFISVQCKGYNVRFRRNLNYLELESSSVFLRL